MDITTSQFSTLSERLLYALEITGTRKADLARAINVKPQVIQFLCSSETKSSRFAFEIAGALGLNTRWLATGEGSMFVADDPKHQLFQSYVPLPVLNIPQIIAKANGKTFAPSESQEHVLFKQTDEKTFCMRMPDQAMQPLMQANSILLIEEIANYTPSNNDMVIAYLPEFQAIVAREMLMNDSNFQLTPQNTQLFQVIPYSSQLQILGVIVECRWSLRR